MDQRDERDSKVFIGESDAAYRSLGRRNHRYQDYQAKQPRTGHLGGNYPTFRDVPILLGYRSRRIRRTRTCLGDVDVALMVAFADTQSGSPRVVETAPDEAATRQSTNGDDDVEIIDPPNTAATASNAS